MRLERRLLLVFLFLLPFLITFVERSVFQPLISYFPLPQTSIYLFKVTSTSLILLALINFTKQTYGLELPKNKMVAKIVGFLWLALIPISFFFLFSLKIKGFFDSLAMIHLINWIITVFREEFILRGIIQTHGAHVLKGRFFKISNSIWLSAIAFSVWHLVNLSIWPWQTVVLQMLSCLPAGIILGLIREKSENTVITYLLHISGDLLFFTFYLLILNKLFFTLF